MLRDVLTPQTDALSLDFLRQVVSPHIDDFTVTLVRRSANPTSVYRVALRSAGGHAVPPSVIVKVIESHWPNDPYGHVRERAFYTEVRPRLPLKHPHLYYAGYDPATEQCSIVMEDLAARYRFPGPTYAWRPEEMRCLLRTYVRLHVAGRDVVPDSGHRAWLWQPHDLRCDPDNILRQADALATMGLWPHWPQLPRLLERTLADMTWWRDADLTLLHNDVFPPNVALPSDLRDEAVLIDWEMVGCGLAEMDLGYLYMQPFRSSRHVPRAEALAYYWQQRQALEGSVPSVEERFLRQRHADAVWALVEIPVAHRMATQPWPAGSAPRQYWDAMFAVLGEWLQTLCDGFS